MFWILHFGSHQVGLKFIYLSESCFANTYEITWTMLLILVWIFDCCFPLQENHFQSILCFEFNNAHLSHVLVFEISHNLLSLDRHIFTKLFTCDWDFYFNQIFAWFTLSIAFGIHSWTHILNLIEGSCKHFGLTY